MALYFLDASALVKYYVTEPGTTWVRTLIDAQDAQARALAHTIFIANISVAEVAAAFAVLHRTGRIRVNAWERAFDRFIGDVSWRYQLLGSGTGDFFRAAILTRHLATYHFQG
ncbi:MAG TPA: type II toxin-antitoxin system VapC family toxin [Ardenticatenaceae bacterium]|nr:type II toxin-antitoxin system VapC family toxin [Ardenticatenaceae bacterium]